MRTFIINVTHADGTKSSYKGLFNNSTEALQDALLKFGICKVKVIASACNHY